MLCPTFLKHCLAKISIVLLCSTQIFAQENDKTKLNALSFELGKTGLIYNLTYDHKLPKKNLGFRFSAGSNFTSGLNAIVVGGGGFFLVGSTKNFLELGVEVQYLIVDEVSDDQKGFAFVYPDYSVKTLYPSLNIGYRTYGKNTLFRIGFSPGIIESKFIPGAYISYGLRL